MSLAHKFNQIDTHYENLKLEGQPGWFDGPAAAESLAGWHRTLGPIMSRFNGQGLLAEFGSGAGNLALSLSSLGWWVIGFEMSPQAVSWARQKAESGGSTAQFEVRDLGEPFELMNSYAGACDLVLDGDCYHYLTKKSRRETFLANARALLAPDGTFVLHTIVGQPPEEMWETLGYDPISRVTRLDGVPMTYFAEVDEILEEVRQAGFLIELEEYRRVDSWRGSDVLTVIARLG